MRKLNRLSFTSALHFTHEKHAGRPKQWPTISSLFGSIFQFSLSLVMDNGQNGDGRRVGGGINTSPLPPPVPSFPPVVVVSTWVPAPWLAIL